MQPAHFIRIKLIELESATDFGEGLRGSKCHCSKNRSEHLHSLKTKEEHQKI